LGGEESVIDTLKDILVFVLSEQDRSAVLLARNLAEMNAAHLSAVFLEPTRDPLLLFEGLELAYANGAWIDELPEPAAAPAARRMMHWRFRAMLRGAFIREVECHSTDEGATAARESRYADVTVLSRPASGSEGSRRQKLFDNVLCQSGRPVLLVPTDWTRSNVGKRIVVAWNGRREAARTLAEAQAFLQRAEQITIVTVAEGMHAENFDGAMRTAQHLERRGLKSQVRLVPRKGRSRERALLDECAALDADLIVMGGYGRPRISEFAFGGVTRTMLQTSPVPVLIAR
jgi:nucleotide-binding universal stress UspA family protein